MEEIAAAGGGIQSSARTCGGQGRRNLQEKFCLRLPDADPRNTTVEAKSGYDFRSARSLKSLEEFGQLRGSGRATVVPTLLGAHVVPREFHDKPEEYIALVVSADDSACRKTKLADFVTSSVIAQRSAKETC